MRLTPLWHSVRALSGVERFAVVLCLAALVRVAAGLSGHAPLGGWAATVYVTAALAALTILVLLTRRASARVRAAGGRGGSR